jgi:hypothetical protein
MTGQQKRLSVEIVPVFSPDSAAFSRIPILNRRPFWANASCVSRGTISIGFLPDMFHVEQAPPAYFRLFQLQFIPAILKRIYGNCHTARSRLS